jgi:hypothetical protein
MGEPLLNLQGHFRFQKPHCLTHWLVLKKNLIDFRSNPKDGRSKCVWITDAGQGFVGQAVMIVAPELTKFLDHLPSDHVLTLIDDLVNIRKWLDTERG